MRPIEVKLPDGRRIAVQLSQLRAALTPRQAGDPEPEAPRPGQIAVLLACAPLDAELR